MLTQLFNMPRDKHFLLACSGGSDSMALADFYARGGKRFTVANFNHSTPQGWEFQEHVRCWALTHKVPFIAGQLLTERPKDKSPEEHWRDERYKWLLSLGEPVVTAHNLTDVGETWLFSAMNGIPRLIPARNGLVLRPFLTTTKTELTAWCVRHGVSWIEDKSNADVSSPRNRIRHNVMPEVLKVNPGFLTVMRKRIVAAEGNQ